MIPQLEKVLRDRFGLSNGQIRDFAPNCRNLVWQVFFSDGSSNGTFGCGDLNDDDIIRISDNLHFEEKFVGWYEYHGTQFQQTPYPMIEITKTSIMFRDDILAREINDAIGME